MTGDGKADLLMVDSDTMTLKWLKSDADYTTQGSVGAVDENAEVL